MSPSRSSYISDFCGYLEAVGVWEEFFIFVSEIASFYPINNGGYQPQWGNEMTTKMYGLVFLTACYLIACCYSQDSSKPKVANGGEAEKKDLEVVLTDAGYANIKGDTQFGGFHEYSVFGKSLYEYVGFGSDSISKKWRSADQFDKIEMKKAMALHTAEVKSKRFILSKLTAKLEDRDDVETAGLFVEVPLPFRLRSHTLFSHDDSGYAGSLKKIKLSELDQNDYAYLKKDNTLGLCNAQDVPVILEKNGVIYNHEFENTLLILNIVDKYETLRDIGKNLKSYNISIEFDSLRLERPLTWGWYKLDSYRKNNRNCEIMHITASLTNEKKQPDYFTTNVLFDSNPDNRPPEILISTIISLKVSKPDGTVIGSYINSKKTAPAPR